MPHTVSISQMAEYLMRFTRTRSFKLRTGRRDYSIIPGFSLTMGITLTMLSLFILIPLASIMAFSFELGPKGLIEAVSDEVVINALKTSIMCAALAAAVNCLFGLIIAWTLVRCDFPGKRILDGLIELPFALPTAVAGITLSKMYSESGQPGSLLAKLGITVSYTQLGILIAMIFIGIPFVVRTVQPVLSKLNPVYEEAAYILGAGRFMTFRKVILPELGPALLSGFGLALARGLGEYGSVIYISGNSARDHTQVASYVIMQKLNYMDYAGATAIALLMLIISFIMLILINALSVFQSRRVSNTYAAAQERSASSGRGARILIALSATYVLVMLVMPLISVMKNAFSKGMLFYLASLGTDYVRSAAGVTAMATIITLVINTVFGLAAAWAITRFSFRGKHLLGTLIDIPLSISPVIAGLAYIMTFGRLGWAWPALQAVNDALGTDIQIVFALPGVVLATVFVTFPFVSRELIPVLDSVGTNEEEAAAMMGAGGRRIFRRITFPHIKWAMIYGMILCAARAMGEFGAVNALSKTRGETFTLPLEIDALYMDGGADSVTAAFAVSSILVITAVAVLIIRSISEHMEKRDVS